MTNKIIFIGPQGSGKGTQAKIIAKELNIPHISSGDIFRDAMSKGTELGNKAKEYYDNGELVPDEVTIGMVKERLAKDDCKNGFILDGFPRTSKQAEMLKQVTDIDKVIEITLPDEIAIERISSRVSCKLCGAVFNIITNPPEKENICNACGGELSQREDDKPEAVEKRLQIYHKETEPILETYKDKETKIDGDRPIKEISEDILNVLRG